MSTPSPAEKEVAATIRAYLETWSDPRDQAVEDTLSYIAEDFTGLGTGMGEYYPNREAMAELFRREKAEMPDAPTSFDLPWVNVRMLRTDLALAECQIRSEVIVDGTRHQVNPRATYVLEKQAERWLILNVHFSMADARQEEGDTLAETLKRRTSILEIEVAERTAELEHSLIELKAAQARLVQQEKLASLGQLTAGIAHEIKNPLNFVTNFASLSQELIDELTTEADPEERDALLDDLKTNAAKIEHHGRRADAIVRAMMAHARSGSGEHQPVALNALVEEYANLAYHGMRAHHPDANPTFNLQLDDAVGTVELAAQEIGRVLINLLDNAFDAVRQRAAEAPDSYTPTVTVSTHQTADGVEIRVVDNGLGMPEAVQANVFEPFFTTKPTGEGTGLGLSLSHDIVTHGHEGTLSIDSIEGTGTTLTVTLPGASS
ncbi:MAG: ATP-binding protein [Bacteroidota bacterium]